MSWASSGSSTWSGRRLPAATIDDRKAWVRANPALKAGFLSIDALAIQAALLPEHEFRVYHLGQTVTGTGGSWLPAGAWEACPRVDPPPDGTEVVLGLAGTWSSLGGGGGGDVRRCPVRRVGRRDLATDDELEQVLTEATARWRVTELVVAPRQRPNLVARLGTTVVMWPNRVDIEVTSSTEWRRAIVEGRVAHDHHPLLAEHVAGTCGPSHAGRVAAADRA